MRIRRLQVRVAPGCTLFIKIVLVSNVVTLVREEMKQLPLYSDTLLEPEPIPVVTYEHRRNPLAYAK
jgi:hypothetical protein